MKMIITVLLLGFPVALVMAWAYELTPQGLRRESEIEHGQSSVRANTSKLDRTITIALILAVVYFSFDKFVLDPRRDAAILESISTQNPVVEPQADPAQPDQASSIAVLPFVNMSDDAGNEYFSDGLSEELLNLLVRIPELRVAARTSSFSYKGKDTKIAQIGQELGVTHVLEGSVRKSGDQLRITAQLIKADDGFHLWSQTYDRTLDNIFQIQDEIAIAVVNELKVTLLGALPVLQVTDPEVYSLYLQGRYLTTPPKGSKEEVENAVSAFKQALVIDPDYVPAWIGLSWAYEFQTRMGVHPRTLGIELSREAADMALAIDDSLAIAWSTQSYLRKRYDWDWDGAKEAMDKALQLEPNNVDVLLPAGSVASSLGLLDMSIELFERAVTLDPLSLMALGNLADRYAKRGYYDEALAMNQGLLVLDPQNSWALEGIAEIYLRQGNPERALTEINKLPYSHRLNRLKAEALFILGQEKESRALTHDFLSTPAHVGPYAKAIIYAFRGENDSAFEFLELAFEQHDSALANILTHDALHHLEDDPRYPVFLEKLGLLEAWKTLLNSTGQALL